MLVALQAQVELGDYRSGSAGEFPDYCHVSAHCLPTRIAALVSHEAVARHHQSLAGTPAPQAKQAVLNLLHSWPLHRAAIFDVTVRHLIFLCSTCNHRNGRILILITHTFDLAAIIYIKLATKPVASSGPTWRSLTGTKISTFTL